MKGVSSELSARIQHLIDELQCPDSLGYTLNKVGKEKNALPLHANWCFLWALRPDGSGLCKDHEALYFPHEPETNPLVLYAVLTQGSRTYPALQELVPARPEGARPCTACEGNGGVSRGQESYDPCSSCDALGWVVTRPQG